MHPTEFGPRLDAHLSRPTRHWTPQVAVRAPRLGIDHRFGDRTLPFHAASVGKLVTTALVLQLVEQGALRLDTPVAEVLGNDELRGLFAPGTTEQVTFEHLLTHTSGVADYFEGKASGGVRVFERATREPDHAWTPASLLAHTRDQQKPVGRPGERYHYSDTGFVLLGRALEAATGQSFEGLAHERIFQPLGMRRTFFPFRTEPTDGDTAIAPLFIGRTDLSRSPSLTCDWAGGGIAGTPGDWLLLIEGLRDGTLIGPDTWQRVTERRHKFRAGLDYGVGTMAVRFEGFMPWLRGWPRLVGHLGITSAHLWHDPESGADIVLNLGSTKAMQPSFRALFEVVRLLRAASQSASSAQAA